ncbi:hypothetical protein BKK79_35845 [Cupriavidus sp. USMAA2-4]|uniref:hypothetical protein n=1 Tax=Cupriavidus sp. USMAA2-4 TaxID=876364 RepID=UPI0008A67514|nr:hypothetical protein [Cupriavidus sp. USMAA2-4]AOY96869.1 hypothetical protein BKK79_35845 [Cupriavidus sp. USMAA2-4]
MLLDQYWTWQLDCLKHAAYVNGLGLAAFGALIALDRLKWDFWFRFTCVLFAVGLAVTLLGLVRGLARLRHEIGRFPQDVETQGELILGIAKRGLHPSLAFPILTSFALFCAGWIIIIFSL